MTNLADDIVQRRGIKKSAPKQAKSIMLITTGAFLCKLDKYGKPTEEFSKRVWQDVLHVFSDKHVIVYLTDQYFWLEQGLKAVEGGATFEAFKADTKKATETTLRLKCVLQDNGIDFHHIRNIRTVSYLRLQEFAKGNVTNVTIRDYEMFGIQPDKELTFQDMIQKRQKSAWP